MTLISVITPTWRRRDLLVGRCLPSVRRQTWRHVEHVVVSDGPDRALAIELAAARLRARPLVFDQLPGHDDSPHNWGSAARNRALELATGEYIAYLDDDNAYLPDHLAILARALDTNRDADFAYSQLLTHPAGNVIGFDPPTYGHIDTSLIMHRAGLPQRLGMWPLAGRIAHADQHAPDWGVVAQWVDGGARWVHVPRVTVDYYVS